MLLLPAALLSPIFISNYFILPYSAIQNLNNTHISDESDKKITDALAALDAELKSYLVNLTAEERKKYGSVNEQNKLFIIRYVCIAPDRPS